MSKKIKDPLIHWLKKIEACGPAIKWVRKMRKEGATAEAMWHLCPKPLWMLWILLRLDLDKEVIKWAYHATCNVVEQYPRDNIIHLLRERLVHDPAHWHCANASFLSYYTLEDFVCAIEQCNKDRCLCVSIATAWPARRIIQLMKKDRAWIR